MLRNRHFDTLIIIGFFLSGILHCLDLGIKVFLDSLDLHHGFIMQAVFYRLHFLGGFELNRSEAGALFVLGSDVSIQGIQGFLLLYKDIGRLLLDQGVGLLDLLKLRLLVGVVNNLQCAFVRYGVQRCICLFDGGLDIFVHQAEEAQVPNCLHHGATVGSVHLRKRNELLFTQHQRVLKHLLVYTDEVHDVLVHVGLGCFVIDLQPLTVHHLVDFNKVGLDTPANFPFTTTTGKLYLTHTFLAAL